MAGVTPRFIEPGIGILGDLGQSPMTVDAGQPFLEHGVPQTLGVWAGMALVAAVQRVGGYCRCVGGGGGGILKFGQGDAVHLKVVAIQIHGPGQSFARQSNVGRKRGGQPEKFLGVGPKIGPADGIGIVREFIGHFYAGGNDLRGIAHLDHLSPEVIEGRQDPQVLKIPVIAMRFLWKKIPPYFFQHGSTL